jgi:two-component system, LytTR family, response regulator
MEGDDRVLCRIEELIALEPEEHSPVHGECRCRELRLVAERAHRLYFIAPCDVDYIQAYGNYVRIHVGEREYVKRDTLIRLEHELQCAGFHRVHRSVLLNLRRVAFAERLGDGALAFTLASGARLASRTRFRLKEWQ